MVRFRGVGAGKGSAARDVDSKKFGRNYDSIFGKKKAPGGVSRWCQHGKQTVKNGRKHITCSACESSSRGSAPFVDCFSTPRWNQGLGCYTSSIHETEKIARSKGLEPIGNERVERIFGNEREVKEKAFIRNEIVDSMKYLRAQKIKEGKL